MNRAQVSVWVVLAPLLLGSALAPAASIPDAPISSHHRHSLAHAASTGPHLRSTSALVLDASDSTVLYARRADVAQPIASITKLLTALVVVDAGQSLDEVLEVTRDDCAIGRGAYSRLSVGTELTRGDLLHLALMSSENRAAHALARNYPGGTPAFVRAMNAKAAALGMTSARFVEPTGLSSDNVASAQDLSKLVAAASHNATIREYSTDRSYEVRVGRHRVQFRNTDSLVSNPAWDIIVQKTGYISEAGRCLVMQAVIEGRSVVIVLLNSFGKYTRVADARRVRRWMESKLTRRALASSDPTA
ncbi:MAG TPA: D-alanyl-D-alanine endopeptidase [Steroidobacteraceae bacterium]|nr:D-alanyl-D-alanine endopeptidase [Steroidobacteraceae bacterium]